MQTEYKGHIIRYAENKDEWDCYEVGFSSPSLPKVKAKIDRLLLQLRKASAVPAFKVSPSYSSACELVPCEVVDYEGPTQKMNYRTRNMEFGGHKVRERSLTHRGDRPSVSGAILEELAADRPENMEIQKAIIALAVKRKAIDDEINALRKTFIRLTIEDIADIVKASGHVFSEGEV